MHCCIALICNDDLSEYVSSVSDETVKTVLSSKIVLKLWPHSALFPTHQNVMLDNKNVITNEIRIRCDKLSEKAVIQLCEDLRKYLRDKMIAIRASVVINPNSMKMNDRYRFIYQYPELNKPKLIKGMCRL